MTPFVAAIYLKNTELALFLLETEAGTDNKGTDNKGTDNKGTPYVFPRISGSGAAPSPMQMAPTIF
jgi:hypothetical protein